MAWRIIGRMLVLVGACALIVLVGLATLWNVRLPTSYLAPHYSWLVDPAVQSRELRASLFKNELSLADSEARILENAAQADPLSDDAFVFAALKSREAGRFHEALGMLEIARKRDPRNRIARLLLADGYLREARAREIVAEAIALEQLRAGTSAIFVPVLADLARQTSTSADTIEALGQTPLAMQVMRLLAKERAEPELLLDFAFARFQAPERSESDRETIARIVTPYIDAGEIRSAQKIWSHFYTGLGPGGLTDPELTGEPGPPFGWELKDASGGIAQFGEQGLEVVDYGRDRWVAARMVMLLPAGAYQVLDEIVSDAQGAPRLAWELECIGSKESLLKLPFSREGFLGMKASDTFAVPGEDCSGQYLTLVGTDEGQSDTQTVTIRSIYIIPLEGSAR